MHTGSLFCIFVCLFAKLIAHKTYYEVMDISTNASADEVKKAYRTLALKLHPDKNHAADAGSKFKELGQAYETLSDPVKRRDYDRELAPTDPSNEPPEYSEPYEYHEAPDVSVPEQKTSAELNEEKELQRIQEIQERKKIQEKIDAQDKIWGSAPPARRCTVGTTSATTCNPEQCTKVYGTEELANATYSKLVQIDDKERRKPVRFCKEHLCGHKKRVDTKQQAKINEYMKLINGSEGYCVFDKSVGVGWKRKYVVFPSCVQKRRGEECRKCCKSSFLVDPESGVHNADEHQDADGPAGCQCQFKWYTN